MSATTPARTGSPRVCPARATLRLPAFAAAVLVATLLPTALGAAPAAAQTTAESATQSAARRPMDLGDLFRYTTLEAADLDPTGRWLVYEARTTTFPDWQRRSDLYLASADGRTTRRLTHTPDADETGPRWHPRLHLVAFTSTRDGGKRQLFFLRPDGGEAWRATDAADGIGAWAWSPDGARLAFLAGPEDRRQIWILPGDGTGPAEPMPAHATGVESIAWAPDGAALYFTAPDRDDPLRRRRTTEKFDVRIVDEPTQPTHLWAFDLATRTERRLTSGDFRITDLELSRDGRWAAFRATPAGRGLDSRASEVYLLRLPDGQPERLTNNHVPEAAVAFSPDARLVAIAAPRDFQWGRTLRIRVRPVAGGEWRELGTDFDRDAGIDFWSDDGRTIVFAADDGVNANLYAADVATGQVRPLTRLTGVVSATRDEDSGQILLRFTDPYTPTDLYRTTLRDLPRPDRWVRLTRLNPWTDSVRLARYETLRWRSTDGTPVEGILILPLDYDPARRYPLVVQLHGGPASAYQNTFGASHGTYPHILAARGYAILQPNYRGSSGYGEHFRTQIAGNYWPRAFEDILTGVDTVIARGIAHPDSLAMMGWSAGGHWSNWTLVSTDRFKAISSGAGVANWISLYAQTDVQATREFYLGGDARPDAPNKPWDNFEHWWNESPLKYIRNARTPTLIHFGERDERIPLPQGLELHMALKKLGVPTELLIYPGQPHGIQAPRYQLVKVMAELGWFERWVRGRDRWLDWQEVLDTADRIAGKKPPATAGDRRAAGGDGG